MPGRKNGKQSTVENDKQPAKKNVRIKKELVDNIPSRRSKMTHYSSNESSTSDRESTDQDSSDSGNDSKREWFSIPIVWGIR